MSIVTMRLLLDDAARPQPPRRVIQRNTWCRSRGTPSRRAKQ
jgi:hypothetical protein